jgi:hemerythrin-like domain-containing protein
MSATPASDLLRSEHRLIEEEIDRLLQSAKRPVNDVVSEVRQAFTGVQCISRLHFAKEEGVLYPYLRGKLPDLLAQMDEQHEYAKEVERNLSELLAEIAGAPSDRQLGELVRFAVELYDVIQHHIVEEEDQLLRLADSCLDMEEQSALAAQMKAADPLVCAAAGQ